ncbi:hypothetical protein BT69DRAFT_824524 [Atractiella rhizophila]|nr:hypothetical protein BT69DRAFT_824524 [Atractiella rhizophila]
MRNYSRLGLLEHLFVSNIVPTLLKVSIDYSESKRVYGDLFRVERNQKINFCTTFPFAAKWIAKISSEREVHKKIERAAARASIRILRLNRVLDAKKEKETDNKLFFLHDPSGEIGLPPSPIRNPKSRRTKDANESLRKVLELCDLVIVEPSSHEPESVYVLDQDWLVENNHPAADPDWIPENGDRLPLEALIASEHFNIVDDDMDWDAIDAIMSTLDLLAPIVRHKAQANSSRGHMSGFSGQRAVQVRRSVGPFALKSNCSGKAS